MRLAVWGSEAANFFQHVRRGGFIHASKALAWRLRTAFYKRLLHFQDTHGWYRYSDWIRLCEVRGEPNISVNSSHRISYLIASNGKNPSYLQDTLNSLIAQTYPYWEAHLLVGDQVSRQAFTDAYVNEPRIHWSVVGNPPSWDQAIGECTGNWLGFLNAGDTLPVYALAILISCLEADPQATIIYTDTDRLSTDGKTRHDPSFWPDWSPELLLSVNYFQRAIFHRPELQISAGKDISLEDAMLRCTEKTNRVIHIPQVLCHLRDKHENPWFTDTFQDENLIDHLERTGLKGVTVHRPAGKSSAQFSWSGEQPLVSIIIPTRDQAALLQRCIDSMLSITDYPLFEIILIENNSQRPETFAYYDQLKPNSQIRLLVHNQPFNYSAFNNWGAAQSSGELLLFMNNDLECTDPGWLAEMVRWARLPDIGIVGAKLLYPNATIQHAGLVVGLEGHANHIFAGCADGYRGLFGSVDWYRDYSAVTGACMMMQRTTFDQLGGFDERYSLAFNDIEICLRARKAGYRVVYTPFARLVHHEGATRATYKPPGDIRLAYQHLKAIIEQGDPYFNPNLSASVRIPSLHRPKEQSSLTQLDLILAYEG